MQKFWKVLDVFEKGIMAAGMAVMVFFNFMNVICRYLLPQTPFSYTEELVVLIFIWVSMIGISYGYRIGSHTALTIVSDLFPLRYRGIHAAFVVIAALASALLMAVIARTGYGMVMNQMKYGQILPGMRIPMAFVGWAIPVGAAVSFISIFRAGYMEIRELWETKS